VFLDVGEDSERGGGGSVWVVVQNLN